MTISKDFKLLGYECYTHWRHGEKDRQDAVEAMAVYGARLAARCGLGLADQGSPEEIGDHFCYGDGDCEWSAAARTAWESAVQRNEVLVH